MVDDVYIGNQRGVKSKADVVGGIAIPGFKIVAGDDNTDGGYIKTTDGLIQISNQDYKIEIVKGNVPGSTLLCAAGSSSSIGTAEQVLWDVAPGTQTTYVWPAAASTVTMVSSHANDNQAGVGARSVRITGLLAGYVASTETLLMHPTVGTTPVTSAKEWLRINRIEVIVTGANEFNVGNITVLNGTDILQYMEAGTNLSIVGIFTVPAGSTAWFDSIRGSASGTKNVEIHLFVREFGGLFRQLHHRAINDSPFEMTCLYLPEKTDVMITVHADVGPGRADLAGQGVIKVNA